MGFVVDGRADLVYRLVNDDVPLRNVLYGTRAISNRANLLDASSVWSRPRSTGTRFVRDAWRSGAEIQVYDGNPPREKDDADDEPTK